MNEFNELLILHNTLSHYSIVVTVYIYLGHVDALARHRQAALRAVVHLLLVAALAKHLNNKKLCNIINLYSIVLTAYIPGRLRWSNTCPPAALRSPHIFLPLAEKERFSYNNAMMLVSLK